MKVYIIVTEFQGIIDDIWVYDNDKKADEKEKKLKKENKDEVRSGKLVIHHLICYLL